MLNKLYNEDSDITNNVLIQFYKLNNLINNQIEYKIIKDEIIKLNNELDVINHFIEIDYINNKNQLELNIRNNSFKLSKLYNKDIENSRNIHKALVKNNIKNIRTSISEDNKNLLKLNASLSDYIKNKETLLQKLKQLNSKKENLILTSKFKVNKLNSDFKRINTNTINVNRFKPQIRKFHSYSRISQNIKLNNLNKSNYSNSSFEINSPSFLELKRILNLYPLNTETQRKIETFLFQQGNLFLIEKFNKLSDINYLKINPKILKKIKSIYPDLENLLNNFRSNLNNKHKYGKEMLKFLNTLDNEIIICFILGRFLTIISNNNP